MSSRSDELLVEALVVVAAVKARVSLPSSVEG